VKNTFIHFPAHPPEASLARGETCPGGFNFGALQALTRLMSIDKETAASTVAAAAAANTALEEAAKNWDTLSRTNTVMSRTMTHDVWDAMNHMTPMPEESAYVTPRDLQSEQFEAVKAKEKKPRGSLKGEKETVDVPDRRVGALIGKKGSHLRELEGRTGATVTVPKEPRNRSAPKDLQVRTVAVSGTPAAVQAALREIRACVAEDDSRGEDPRSKRGQTTTQIEIWEAQVKWVVGVDGKTVAAIERDSGATISIPKHGWSRTVTVRGDAQSCAAAEHIIECMLPYTKEFYDVPAWKIGSLLGVRGETIKKIEAWSQATISVPRDGDYRTVIICGDKETHVLRAAGEVQAVLDAAKQAPKRGGGWR
jgi:rRNA processing protein Krr1/Pno1